MKKRLLCLMASLLLCGAAIAQEPAYVREHDNNMPVVAQVVLDEVPVTTSEWTLKAYIGDDQRGEAVIQTSLNNTYWIQVYYSTDTEDDTPVTFKIANANNQEYTSTTTLNTLAEGYGTPLQPQEIEFAATQTQSTTLAEGWTWWSTPIEMEGVNGLAMLENALGSNGIIIKSKTQSAIYYEAYNRWVGNCPITNEGSYMIKVNNQCQVTLTGTWANPEEHPIQIKANDWTWIGYPVNQSQNVTSALANFQPEVGDVVKSGGVSSVYFSTALGWRPANFAFNPGVGYRYKSNAASDKTLTYVNPINTRGFEEKNLAEDLYWNANYNIAEGNITLLAKVYVDGEEQRTENLELGAFVNGECRGNAKLLYIEQPIDAYYVIMTISGEEGDVIDFELFNAEDGSINTNSKSRLVFKENDVVGEPENPYAIDFYGKGDKNMVLLQMFPNPVDRNQSFTVNIPKTETISMISITDMLGSTIYQKVNPQHSQIDAISVSGIYLVKVICESGKLYYGRIVVE